MAAAQMDRPACWRPMAENRQRARAARARPNASTRGATIDRFIYRPRQKAEKLWKLLPRGKARRGPRKRRETTSTITDRRSIHDRPEAVQSREKIGDREADLMFCRRTRPVLVLHERVSRLTLAAKLAGKRAASIMPTAGSEDSCPGISISTP